MTDFKHMNVTDFITWQSGTGKCQTQGDTYRKDVLCHGAGWGI